MDTRQRADLDSLRAAALAVSASHRAAPSFERGNWEGLTAAWGAYRAAAKDSPAPRPEPTRGLRFESAVWVDYDIRPAQCQVTRITRDLVYYGMIDCTGKVGTARYYVNRADFAATCLPMA